MTNYARLFKRALDEGISKTAFQPMPGGQPEQAPGPGGMPVDPMAGGGAAMDPMMGGAPPMDPGMGGAPPMDPGMDPAMGGAPPMDPMMGGEGDPGADLLDEMPPLPGDEEGADGEASISGADVEALKAVQDNTMEIVRQTLEMVGKAKPVEKPEGEDAAAPAAPAEPPPPVGQPGPVTGQPGFDPSMVGGPLKLGQTLHNRFRAN